MKIIKTVFSKENNEINDRKTAEGCSILFAAVAFVLSCLNALKLELFFGTISLLIAAGFLVALVCVRKERLSGYRTIMCILLGLGFSCVFIAGADSGYAVLWSLLMPVICPLILGQKYSIYLNSYILLLLIAFSYTPLSEYIAEYYEEGFMLRFPILFFAIFALSEIIMCQRQNLYLEIERQANYDALTKVFNRRHFIDCYKKIDEEGNLDNLTVFSIDLNGVKNANDTLGHEAGDELILNGARLIQESFDGDLCFRTGGDEFAVISFRDKPEEDILKLKKACEEWKGNYALELALSIGYVKAEDNKGRTFEELFRVADKKMYEDKAAYYRQVNMIEC